MTELELEIQYEWQLYAGVVAELRMTPTSDGFIKFRKTPWTKETCTPELVRKRAKDCQELANVRARTHEDL
jgi:hypothetical protein